MSARDIVGQGVVTALDSVRGIRPSTRDGERHYREGTRFRAQADAWSDEQRRDWMLQRLRSVVRYAAKETRFYRERFRSIGFDPESPFGFEDYARLPILERQDVHDHLAEMVVASVPSGQRRKDGTGGSTGIPLQYWSGPEERGWRASGQDHVMTLLGVPRGVSTAFLWGHQLDAAAKGEWSERVRDRITNRRWFDCFRLSPELLVQYHGEMEAFAPAALVCYASALDALAAVLHDRGLTAGYPTRRIVTGAEKLWGHQRARAEQVFTAPIHERYGSREAGLIGFQRDPRRSLAFEVDFANAFVEPEHATPESEILLTKLHGDAMPMLRYRMGDVARFPEGSRPGHPALQLDEVLGRRLDRLALPDGRWLHGVGIPHLMKDFPIREFQIRQHEDFTVDVLVVPNEGFLDADGEAILSMLRLNLPGLAMQLQRVAEVPRGAARKWHPVISLATPAPTGGATARESNTPSQS